MKLEEISCFGTVQTKLGYQGGRRAEFDINQNIARQIPDRQLEGERQGSKRRSFAVTDGTDLAGYIAECIGSRWVGAQSASHARRLVTRLGGG
jgi:hypothetical protein